MPRILTVVLLVPLLAGCQGEHDPVYNRDGAWRATGANDRNLAVMLVRPEDLVRGNGSQTTDGQRAAAAIGRLREDRVKALPDVSSLRSTAGGSAGTPGAAGGF